MSEKADMDWQAQLHEADLLKIVSDPEPMVGLERVDQELGIRLLTVSDSFHNVAHEETIDDFGHRLLPKAIDGDVYYASIPRYWQTLKDEFRVFVCTTDKRYADLRNKLSSGFRVRGKECWSGRRPS